MAENSNIPFTKQEKIAVVRALRGLGDMLCVGPALRALRVARPQAQISLIGLAEVRPLVERFQPYIDELIEFPGWPGMPERQPQPHEIPAFLQEVQERRFDLAIQMHGNGATMNPLTVLLGAREVAGLYQSGHYCPDPARFLPYVEQESEVRRYLRLLEHLGIPGQGDQLEFPLGDEDHKAYTILETKYRLAAGRFVCLHPGATDPARRWAVEHFAAVGDSLAMDGWQVVLTGNAGEHPLTRAVQKAMHFPAVNLAGQTELGSLAGLISRARLLICNDTGVSHLAAALDVPSVVIFLAADPQRWGPLDRQLHRVVTRPGRANLPVETVLGQVAALLHENAPQAA